MRSWTRKLAFWLTGHAPQTRLRDHASLCYLCRYVKCRFIVASGLAESRGGLVATSLTVVSAGKSRRCGADSAEAFARGVGLSSASAEWEPRRTNHIMLQGEI